MNFKENKKDFDQINLDNKENYLSFNKYFTKTKF